jgi:hypothetical protein
MAGRGRPQSLTPEEAEHIRDLYFKGVTPRGKRYKLTDIARLYTVSVKTIANVVEFKAPYEKEGQDERQTG